MQKEKDKGLKAIEDLVAAIDKQKAECTKETTDKLNDEREKVKATFMKIIETKKQNHKAEVAKHKEEVAQWRTDYVNIEDELKESKEILKQLKLESKSLKENIDIEKQKNAAEIKKVNYSIKSNETSTIIIDDMEEANRVNLQAMKDFIIVVQMTEQKENIFFTLVKQ